MQTLPARFTYLRNAELLSAVALSAALCFFWLRSGEPVDWAVRVAALALVGFILLQGALYWHLKLQTVVRRTTLPAWFASLYQGFRYANCLGFVAVGGYIGLATSAGLPGPDLAWAGGLLAFALLEHINYYHYQLMYDTRAAFAYVGRNKRLRKAALGIDLQRCAHPQKAGVRSDIRTQTQPW